MSTADVQLALSLDDVPTPQEIRAMDIVPGDRLQVRSHAGSRLWVTDIVATRTYWRRARYAAPCDHVYYLHTTTLTDHNDDRLYSRLSPYGTVEVVSRTGAQPTRRRRRRPVPIATWSRARAR
jgi:hypothetical protein